ncbi:MAG: hypothetical protein SFW08_04140 [Gemmatimonadaceae bacterium]|nr:hypothetical protein [Gemmatimonadaceae bacterium]
MTAPATFGPPTDPRLLAWFDAGVKGSTALSGRASAVIVGRDPDATAWAALGLARALAPIRRVALGDLIGDAPPLVSLLADGPPEGIVDSFLYGVSLNRIAREVRGLPNCFVLPSGSEDVQQEAVLASDRWKRLAAGFGEVGAILLLCVTADAPGLDALVEHVGGAVCVGTDVILGPSTQTITTLIGPARASAAVIAPLPPPEKPLTQRPTTDFRAVLDDAMQASPLDADVAGGWSPPPPAAPPPSRARRTLIITLVLLATMAGGAGLARWRYLRMQATAAAAAPPVAVTPSAPVDSTPTAPDTAAAIDTMPIAPLEVANPADSLLAAGWAVELVAENTESGARARLADPERPMVAGTWSPSTIAGGRSLWYKVLAGATVTRPAAESLLVQLRRGGALDAEAGRVVRVPYAFRLAADVPSDSATAYLAGFAGLGLPAYALRRPDGRADVLSGAFESPQQAALHVPALRAARVEPVLVYRTGRAF